MTMIAVPRDHIHAGKHYKRGMLVDLPEADIAWLMRAEGFTRAAMVAEIAPEPVAEAPEPVIEPEPDPEPEPTEE